ncbi:MAG: prepilin-type N-terminal cleavage/methylation domain-containing protein [Planctomycetia bacterium]|nr:prepilin-type N-terminal cleavage/methylation domain-containing protein [Planctomycetia bacterium]
MMIRHVTRQTGRNVRAGFTLAELLAVVAILAILAGVAIPTYITLIGNQRIRVAKTECKKFASILKNFAADNQDEFPQTNGFPMMNGGLDFLVSAGMLPQVPLDPWGRPYFFELVQSPTGAYEPIVISGGPDGNGHPQTRSDAQ